MRASKAPLRRGESDNVGPRGLARLSAVGLVAVLMTGSMTAMPGEWKPDKEIRYTVDMVQLREAFNATQTVRLLVPDRGEIVVAGERINLGCHGDCYYSVILENGTTIRHRHYSIPLEGKVLGFPESYANLLLGTYGVYGRISVPGAEFLFDPVFIDPGFEQEVALNYMENPGSRVPSALLSSASAIPPLAIVAHRTADLMGWSL